VTPSAAPAIPWQFTGNHWIAIPCIHPADASLHAVGLLHRGARAAIEFAGAPDFAAGTGAPLLRPVISINGVVHPMSAGTMAWERALGWIPTFTCTLGTLVVRGTIFAPFGRDSDVPGAIYTLSVENRGDAPADVAVAMQGALGHRQLRVRTPRPFTDPARVAVEQGVVVVGGSSAPEYAALAITADGDGSASVQGETFEVARSFVVAPGAREQVAWYLGVGPERDGAQATVEVLRRRGWKELMGGTRDALRSLEQSTGSDAMDRLINRNLLFAYFYGVGRALDDAHYYLVRTRAPWHSLGVTLRDWEALSWTIPAVQLADPPLARELLIRTCELHGYAPGRGVNYLDGTLFQPGFSLEAIGAYPLAVERYIRDTGDDRIVDEPVVAETLYAAAEELDARRDEKVPLYRTEVTPSGAQAAHPYTLHGNAVVAQAFDILRRTLDEETSGTLQDPEAIRAAMRRHFVVDRDGKQVFATAVDLSGGVSMDDDPGASVLWLPLYDAVGREDSTYRRSVKGLGAEPSLLVLQCARLLGPDSAAVLQWLRRAPLDGGAAAELVDADGRAVGNLGDAALSGLLAWTVWYAVHALGERG
jgi:hypothetical protein